MYWDRTREFDWDIGVANGDGVSILGLAETEPFYLGEKGKYKKVGENDIGLGDVLDKTIVGRDCVPKVNSWMGSNANDFEGRGVTGSCRG